MTDSLDEIMPTITLVVDKTDVIVYANDTQLFKTPIDNEITLSSIPIHKDSQAALLKWRDGKVVEELKLVQKAAAKVERMDSCGCDNYLPYRIKQLEEE